MVPGTSRDLPIRTWTLASCGQSLAAGQDPRWCKPQPYVHWSLAIRRRTSRTLFSDTSIPAWSNSLTNTQPARRPSSSFFQIESSGAERLVIRHVQPAATATYRCEVTVETTFETDYREINVTVLGNLFPSGQVKCVAAVFLCHMSQSHEPLSEKHRRRLPGCTGEAAIKQTLGGYSVSRHGPLNHCRVVRHAKVTKTQITTRLITWQRQIGWMFNKKQRDWMAFPRRCHTAVFHERLNVWRRRLPIMATITDINKWWLIDRLYGHADAPLGDPVIEHMRAAYADGDELNINCTSFESRPAARLEWVINGQPVNASHDAFGSTVSPHFHSARSTPDTCNGIRSAGHPAIRRWRHRL